MTPMTRIARYILLTLTLLAATSSCTHNDGDIGPLFGSWILDSMTLDGQPYTPDVDGYTCLQFQGKVIMAKIIDDRHSLLFYSVGSWERTDNTLYLDYTHSDNDTPPGEGAYSAPYWLMLKPNAVNEVSILSLNSRHMHLRHITPDGDIVEYTFHKTF